MSTPTPDDQTPPPPPATTITTSSQSSSSPRLPVQTHHCRFCNHLLLATTRSIPSLPRRKAPAKDGALILPLPRDHSIDDEQSKQQKHYTILLSTTIPDRKHTLVRRQDGFEKRLFLRCGRCRVVMGYFLDEVHFGRMSSQEGGDGEGEGEKARVVYLLPGALVETGVMMRDEELEKVVKGLDREWAGWLEG
ncbi:hypothetical protein BO83DRAFT_349868 [Aspergillus eucalypticola CBS 122712]|uniref:STEEP1 domain-containing protein n=1 Tax=Aspergillus eucalypticola (strain CBS 122712 / IBT 29274) TaxID=1448314 RepID=A0A317UMD5_ASPEC|nr:uncharacterized protein BO83DRAFT_349868 [Aspergillus eucalypticola CBS 122712]PWY62308.1 hypothetical protein BO83DRAFT_349868 [Aspergillus eucalypticola CBS 122712]